jgi:hypothetical protein
MHMNGNGLPCNGQSGEGNLREPAPCPCSRSQDCAPANPTYDQQNMEYTPKTGTGTYQL